MRKLFLRIGFLVLLIAASGMAAAAPASAVCVFPPGATQPICGSPGPGIPIPSSPAMAPKIIGPQRIHVGQFVRLRSNFNAREMQVLCYRAGSSRSRCSDSRVGLFYLRVRPGKTQVFTLEAGGLVRARRVYYDVS